MIPECVLDAVPNLMISTTPNGIQGDESLLACYNELDVILKQKNVQRPVLIISDGHSSRFELELLQFLQKSEIRLFILPPDTTGVTQKHDQLNQKIHTAYKESNSELFSPFSVINRKGFMTILSYAR